MSHSLPVDHLENLLLKHMSKFFYPLGLLLFCKDGNSGEEVEKQQTAMSMLNHLSTRFSLQLCSNLLSHIDQSKNTNVKKRGRERHLPDSPSSFCSSDVYRRESGRCRSLPIFLSFYLSRFSFILI